jgi:Tol biopolymer transport system component
VDTPAWSPDGKLIAVVVYNHDSSSDIYTMAPNGTNLQPLTHAPAFTQANVCQSSRPVQNNAPAWEPTGHRIVYLSNADRANEGVTFYSVFVMNADGTNQHVLVSQSPWQTQFGCPNPPMNDRIYSANW